MEHRFVHDDDWNMPSPTTRFFTKPEPWVLELEGIIRRMNVEIDTAIVEGPRDESGLRHAGFESTVKKVGTATNLLTFVDSIDANSIVILTDYDREGKRINAMLREHLPESRCNIQYRRDIGRVLTKHGRYDIESLNNIFETVI